MYSASDARSKLDGEILVFSLERRRTPVVPVTIGSAVVVASLLLLLLEQLVE